MAARREEYQRAFAAGPLHQRGFQVGLADGIVGPATQTALRNFQVSENRRGDGPDQPETPGALGVQSS